MDDTTANNHDEKKLTSKARAVAVIDDDDDSASKLDENMATKKRASQPLDAKKEKEERSEKPHAGDLMYSAVVPSTTRASSADEKIGNKADIYHERPSKPRSFVPRMLSSPFRSFAVSKKAKGISVSQQESLTRNAVHLMPSSLPTAHLDPQDVGQDVELLGTEEEEDTAQTGTSVQRSTPREPQLNVQPGAFHNDGRNAREVIVNDEWSTSIDPEDQLVSAEVVDPEEVSRKVEQELAERQRNLLVAKVVANTEEIDEEEPETESSMFSPCDSRRKRVVLVAGIVLAFCVVLGVVLSKVLTNPPQDDLSAFLSSVSFDEGAALRMRFTPQNDALNWLASNANLDRYSDKQKIQRYVLVTLYFSTDGNNWKDQSGWLSDDNECGWYSEADNFFCLGKSIVELDMSNQGTGTGNMLAGTIPNEIALLSDSLGNCLSRHGCSFLQDFPIH